VTVRLLNDAWPWFGTLRGRPFSVAELISSGTLSREAAAILWWAIDRGASVFTAAGPSGAGKSTLANALLEFLPEGAAGYVTSGPRDPLALEGPMYLLINELSDHMWLYLSGPAAQRAFSLLKSGDVRIIGTLHARSVQEAVMVIAYEAALTPVELASPFVIAVVAASRQPEGIVRRVVELGFLDPSGETHLLLQHDTGLEVGGIGALASWAHLSPAQVSSEIAQRATRLPSSGPL
jgi:energy-coupling factor transporter ATP-binding protein EcfA2